MTIRSRRSERQTSSWATSSFVRRFAPNWRYGAVGFRWSFGTPERIVRLYPRAAPAAPMSDWEGNAAHEQAAICRGRGEFADADRGSECGRADRTAAAEGTGGPGADRRHRARDQGDGPAWTFERGDLRLRVRDDALGRPDGV